MTDEKALELRFLLFIVAMVAIPNTESATVEADLKALIAAEVETLRGLLDTVFAADGRTV